MTMRAIQVDGAEPATETWPEGGGYHLSHRLFFTRLLDGGVLIRKYDSNEEGAEPVFSIRCTPDSWASVVASMELGGETVGSWSDARKRQLGEECV